MVTRRNQRRRIARIKRLINDAQTLRTLTPCAELNAKLRREGNNERTTTMPQLKPDNGPSYLQLGPQPLDPIARQKRNDEVKANLLAFLKLLALSALAGAVLAFRK